MIREIRLRMRKECRKEERRIQIIIVVKTREEEDWNREKVTIVGLIVYTMRTIITR